MFKIHINWITMVLSTSVFAVMAISTSAFHPWDGFSFLVLLAVFASSITAVYLITRSFRSSDLVPLLVRVCLAEGALTCLNYLLYQNVGGIIQLLIGLSLLAIFGKWLEALDRNYQKPATK